MYIEYIRLNDICQNTLQWRHNERDGVSNHQRLDCLLNRLFRGRSKKTLKLRVTGLCERNPPVTGGFPTQCASNAENVSIWWRHRGWYETPSHISYKTHIASWLQLTDESIQRYRIRIQGIIMACHHQSDGPELEKCWVADIMMRSGLGTAF